MAALISIKRPPRVRLKQCFSLTCLSHSDLPASPMGPVVTVDQKVEQIPGGRTQAGLTFSKTKCYRGTTLRNWQAPPSPKLE